MKNRESDDRDVAARLAESIAGPLVHCIWCGGAVDPSCAVGEALHAARFFFGA